MSTFNKCAWLVNLMRGGREYTLSQIKERWLTAAANDDRQPLAMRTFFRLRNQAEEYFGAEIVCRKRNGTYYYRIANEAEIEADGPRRQILQTMAVRNIMADSGQLRKRILYEEIPSGEVYLTPILEAMRDCHRVSLVYHSFGAEAKALALEPYIMKLFNRRWYLLARDVETGLLDTYSLDRVDDLRVCDDIFEFPQDFDARDYFGGAVGVQVNPSVPTQRVLLKVSCPHRDYVRTLPLHPSQTEESDCGSFSIFSYMVRPSFEFLQCVLAGADMIEVLEPASFRGYIREYLEEMLSFYQEY